MPSSDVCLTSSFSAPLSFLPFTALTREYTIARALITERCATLYDINRDAYYITYGGRITRRRYNIFSTTQFARCARCVVSRANIAWEVAMIARPSSRATRCATLDTFLLRSCYFTLYIAQYYNYNFILHNMNKKKYTS